MEFTPLSFLSLVSSTQTAFALRAKPLPPPSPPFPPLLQWFSPGGEAPESCPSHGNFCAAPEIISRDECDPPWQLGGLFRTFFRCKWLPGHVCRPMGTSDKLRCGLTTLGWITLPAKHFLSSVGDSCRRSGVLGLSGTTTRSTRRILSSACSTGAATRALQVHNFMETET